MEISAERSFKFLEQFDVHLGFQGSNAKISIRRKRQAITPPDCEIGTERKINFEWVERESNLIERN